MSLDLDAIKVDYSHKQPNLVTLIVGEAGALSGGAADSFEWSLFTFDKHNEKQHQYKLHTIDVYLWTPSDATILLDALRKVLKDHQLHITDLSGKRMDHVTNDAPAGGIEQKLERMTVDDQQATQHNRLAGYSQGMAEHQQAQYSTNTSTSHIPQISGSEQPSNKAAITSAVDKQDYKPLAYNPAAPAAPEPIKHREKTPPPSDVGPGNGFIAAGNLDQNFQPGGIGGRPVPPVSPVPSYGQSSDTHSFATSGAHPQPYAVGSSASHQNIPSSGFAPPPSVSPLGSQSGQGFQPPPATTPGAPPPPPPPLGQSPSTTQTYGSGPHLYGHPSFTSQKHGSMTPSSDYAPQQPTHPQQPQQPLPAAQSPYQQQPLSSHHSQFPQQSNPSQPYNPYPQPGVGTPSFQPPAGGGGYVSGPHGSQNQQYGHQPHLQNPYGQQQPQYYHSAPGQTPGAPAVANNGSFGAGPNNGRFEKNAQMLEKGVNKFLKKLDKRF